MSRVNLPNEVRAEQWTGVAATLLDHIDALHTGEEAIPPHVAMAALARFFQSVLNETGDTATIAVLTSRLVAEGALQRRGSSESEGSANEEDEARTLKKIRELSEILTRLKTNSCSSEQEEALRSFLEDLLRLGQEKQRARHTTGANL